MAKKQKGLNREAFRLAFAQSATLVCPDCEGSGKTNPRLCCKCRGAGRDLTHPQLPCPKCNGQGPTCNGLVFFVATCTTCRGTGALTLTEANL